MANALKQTAMLTSSATRNAIYKSFSRNADNIGDITAKGEAQIAVVDLLGECAGVCCEQLDVHLCSDTCICRGIRAIHHYMLVLAFMPFSRRLYRFPQIMCWDMGFSSWHRCMFICSF